MVVLFSWAVVLRVEEEFMELLSSAAVTFETTDETIERSTGGECLLANVDVVTRSICEVCGGFSATYSSQVKNLSPVHGLPCCQTLHSVDISDYATV